MGGSAKWLVLYKGGVDGGTACCASTTHSGKHAAPLQELSEPFQRAVAVGKLRNYGSQAAFPLNSCCGDKLVCEEVVDAQIGYLAVLSFGLQRSADVLCVERVGECV